MNTKTATILAIGTLLMAGMAVVPNAFAYTSELDNVQLHVGVSIFDSTIYNPSDGKDRANQSVVDALNRTNPDGLNGTINKTNIVFKLAKNPESGVQDPKSKIYYPSAYIGSSSDKSSEPSICSRGESYEISFSVPAGNEFGVRIKGVSGSTAHVAVSGCTGSQEYSGTNGMFFGEDSTGKVVKSTQEMLWFTATEDTVVTISGHASNALISNYLQIQVYMKPTY